MTTGSLSEGNKVYNRKNVLSTQNRSEKMLQFLSGRLLYARIKISEILPFFRIQKSDFLINIPHQIVLKKAAE